MIELNGQPGELHMTIQITRKETGKTEEVELVGYLDPEQLKQLNEQQENSNGRNPL